MRVKVNVKVKITVHRDVLVIETQDIDNDDHPDWTPVGNGSLGCVLSNTKTWLGVSPEALEWLKTVPRSHDDIGDVDWFSTEKAGKCFAWLGGKKSLKTKNATGSQYYQVFPDDCILIPNDVPEEAIKIIDNNLPPLK